MFLALVVFRKECNPSTLETVLICLSFQKLLRSITQARDGTKESMAIAYLKDASSMLVMVLPVSIERRLQSEHDMLKKTFVLIKIISVIAAFNVFTYVLDNHKATQPLKN